MAKKKVSSKLSLDALRSKYPGSGVASEYLIQENEMFWVPSSSPVINAQIGGGAAYGRIMEIAGKEASGKTLIALDLIKSAQELGGIGIFIDAELAFSKPWAELNGLDLSQLYLLEDNTIEVIADFVAETCFYYRSILTANEPIVLVIDSIAALETQAAMETSAVDAKAEMGSRAKAFYHLLRVRNRLWAKLGIAVICINQLRDAINTGYGAKFKEKVTTVGGNALKFYASQRIFLEAKKQLIKGSKVNRERYGVEVEFLIKKNKLDIPRVPIRIEVIFDPSVDDLGFSKYQGLAEILVRRGAVTKQGNSIVFDGDVVANGIVSFQDALETDDDLREDILLEAGILTIEQMQVRLDTEVNNRYPVDGVKFTSFTEAVEGDEEEDDD